MKENENVIKKQNSKHVHTIPSTAHQPQKQPGKYVILFFPGP